MRILLPRRAVLAVLAVLASALLAAAATPTLAQSPPSAAPTSDEVKVFLDCEWRCDSDFLQTEIPYVSWVRDRAVADVHMLVTTQETGGGGTEFTVAFLGLRRFAGIGDTLRTVTGADATDDDRRRSVARVMKAGLVRYVARTAALQRLTVGVSAPSATAGGAPRGRDPWNAWTFSLEANSWFSEEECCANREYYGQANASRTTEAWKLAFRVSTSQNSQRYTYDTSGVQVVEKAFRRSFSAGARAVRGLGAHWSAALTATASSNTFVNQRLNATLLPAVEYNVFPYGESTRRQLRVQYGVGGRHFAYVDTTVYNRLSEAKPLHRLAMALDARQPWGTVTFNARVSQYLDTPRNFNWSVNPEARLRLFKGFSINGWMWYEGIRDQIYLPKGAASPTDVLLRQRQLETGYSLFGGVGFSYTFGSIYSSIVNPRFGGTFEF